MMDKIQKYILHSIQMTRKIIATTLDSATSISHQKSTPTSQVGGEFSVTVL